MRKRKLSVVFDKKIASRIDNIKSANGCNTDIEVIVRALAVYDHLMWGIHDKGYNVLFVRKDGKHIPIDVK